MSFEKSDFRQKSNENLKIENKIKNFEKIKTPEELLSFMKDNVHYGYIGRNNKSIYTFDSPENKDRADTDFEREYYLQSPEELLESDYGVCWDQTEFERYWFSRQKPKYNFKTLIMFDENNPKEGINPHTFLAFERSGKWFWFEHSFKDFRGIHTFNALEDLLVEVVKNVRKSESNYLKRVTDEDIKNIKVCEYNLPSFGSSPKEFVLPIVKEKRPCLIRKSNKK